MPVYTINNIYQYKRRHRSAEDRLKPRILCFQSHLSIIARDFIPSLKGHLSRFPLSASRTRVKFVIGGNLMKLKARDAGEQSRFP